MRTLSSDMLQALAAQETGEAILALVTIEHASLTDPIRVTSNGVDITSNGNTFVALPFEFKFPEQREEGQMTAKLQISNVDRRIVEAVREASTQPKVTTQFVLGSTPDTIEAEFPKFEMTEVNYDEMTVSAKLSLESPTRAAFPSPVFTPFNFPGVF